MKNIINLHVICLALFAVSCDNPSVFIVEQNDSYTLDSEVINVDMPKKNGYNTSNFIKREGAEEIVLTATFAEEAFQLANNEIPLVFKLRRELEKGTKFIFVPDDELMKRYTGKKDGFTPFPENAFESLEFTIPSGVKEFKTSLQLSNIENLLSHPETGLLSAFRLKPTEDNGDITVSAKSEALYIKLNFSKLNNSENVSLSPRTPSGAEVNSDLITPKSNNTVAPALLSRLFDGDYSRQNYWLKSKSGYYLELSLAEIMKVSGVVFYTNNTNKKSIRSVKVEVSDDGGETWFEQGSIVSPTPLRVLNVAFNAPVEVNRVRFSDFISHSDYVDIYEMEIYKVVE